LAPLLIYAVPFFQPHVWPFILLNTQIHEICHAVAAVATGGSVEKIIVYRDGNGVTPILGSWILVTAAAGYVGSTVVGAALLLSAARFRSARYAVFAVGIGLLAANLVWVRGDGLGWLLGFLWAAALIAAGRWMSDRAITVSAAFLGMAQIAASINAVYDLLRISAFTERSTDARVLESATGVPAMVWAVIWSAISVAVGFVTVRRLLRHSMGRPERPGPAMARPVG
jgi:hypothetical protein